jgi:hypothetical protein
MVTSESGFDARSVDFLEKEGIEMLSCSGVQVAKNKVLSAQAHIRHLAGTLALI